MKLIKIAETDSEYRKGLSEILIGEGAVPVVLEVPDDYDLDSYEGLELFEEGKKLSPPTPFKFPEVAAWLENYKGNFEFYVSLKAQFAAKGMLSDKQIAAVQRAIEREGGPKNANAPKAPQEFTLKTGEVILISKFIANRIAQSIGYQRAHRVFEVLEVEHETPKAYRAKVKLSARKTSHCGICGRILENAESIAAGIGPICADKTSISFGPSSLNELAHLIGSAEHEAVVWIPKAAIKERLGV